MAQATQRKRSRKKGYSPEGVISAFDIPAIHEHGKDQPTIFDFLVSADMAIDALRHNDVTGYHCKTIKAGDVLECEIFPMQRDYSDIRKAKAALPSSPSQRKLNDKNSAKRITRLANANFGRKDIALHPTYATAVGAEQAQKDAVNYIRRLKRYAKKHGFPQLKYIYVVEGDGEGDGEEMPRAHLHIITNFPDRDAAEKLWKKGRCNSKKLQPDDYGLADLTNYMAKSRTKKRKPGQRRWGASRNLKEPQITTHETKIRKKHANRMVRDIESAPMIFEEIYSGYELVEMPEIKRSRFMAGAYIYAIMKKRE